METVKLTPTGFVSNENCTKEGSIFLYDSGKVGLFVKWDGSLRWKYVKDTSLSNFINTLAAKLDAPRETKFNANDFLKKVVIEVDSQGEVVKWEYGTTPYEKKSTGEKAYAAMKSAGKSVKLKKDLYLEVPGYGTF